VKHLHIYWALFDLASFRVHFSLYGAWQVEPYVIAPLVDGIIPMNEHGNIEIWDGNRHLLPPGTCLLEEPGAAKVCLFFLLYFSKQSELRMSSISTTSGSCHTWHSVPQGCVRI
jgi:hypothetical protein